MKQSPPALDEYDLVRSICRESFYDFVKEFWDVVIPEDPIWNWHIQFLCTELQRVAERVFQMKPKKHDLIINISPGSTKSTVCSVMFPAWTWTRMPTCKCICASYDYNLAMDLSRKSRDIIYSDKYRKAFEIELREDQNTKGFFSNTKGGGRYCVGTGGSITGRHGHFLIVDDPIDPTGAVSEIKLKEVNRWMDQTFSQRKIDKAVTPTILIMQRLHQNDPTAHMLEKSKEHKEPSVTATSNIEGVEEIEEEMTVVKMGGKSVGKKREKGATKKRLSIQGRNLSPSDVRGGENGSVEGNRDDVGREDSVEDVGDYGGGGDNFSPAASSTAAPPSDRTTKKRVRLVCLPGELTEDVSPKSVIPLYKDGLMDPVRGSRMVLTAALEELGEYGYAGQILQKPTPAGGGLFKWERIHVGEQPGTQFVYVMRFWDKAGTEAPERMKRKGPAYTVGLKMAMDQQRRIWVLDVIRGRWSTERREAIILATARMDGRKVVIGLEQEPGSGGKESAESTAKNLIGYRVKIDIPKGDKTLRADPYSVQVNAGNVYLAPGPWNRAYLTEMEFFPYSTYKDQVDASSGAFYYVSKGRTRVGGLRGSSRARGARGSR